MPWTLDIVCFSFFELLENEVDLSAMIVDIGVVLVMGKSRRKGSKSSLCIAELHVHARNFHPHLDEARNNGKSGLQIIPRTKGVTC